MFQAKRLRELRKNVGLTQAEVAKNVNIERTTYVRYEKGQISPPDKMIGKLASFFDVSTDYLLGRTQYKYRLDEKGRIVVRVPNMPKLYEFHTTERGNDPGDDYYMPMYSQPLESYSEWLYNMGITIGDGSNGELIAKLGEHESYDITDSLDNMLEMSKEHFKMMARQLGKGWPPNN
jgi:transcriptional regulator with XRE-family HTH domain